MEPYDLENQIKDFMKSRIASPSHKSWEAIEGMLDQRRRRNRSIIQVLTFMLIGVLNIIIVHPIKNSSHQLFEPDVYAMVDLSKTTISPPLEEYGSSDELQIQEVKQDTPHSPHEVETIGIASLKSADIPEEVVVLQHLNRVKTNDDSNITKVTDDELDRLLTVAQEKLDNEREIQARIDQNADLLLTSVDRKIDEPLDMKIVRVLKPGFKKLRKSVTN